jgi:ABC-2 type transport system permease protein
MNIFLQELKMARTAMVWWIIALVTVTLMFVSIFPAFHYDIKASQNILANFPPQIRNIFGISLSTFFTFLGFYAYVLTYIAVAGAVQAMNLGLTMLGREVKNATTDFLLTKPISRSRIFIIKFSAALVVLFITNVVLICMTLLFARKFEVGDVNLTVFSLLVGSFSLVQLLFLAIGSLVSQCIGRIRSTISVSLAVVFSFFAINLLQGLTNDETLRYVTPFKYFDHLKIVVDQHYDAPFVWLSIGVFVVSLFGAYILFLRQDTRSPL